MTFAELWDKHVRIQNQLAAIEPTESPVAVQSDENKELREELRKHDQLVLGHPESFEPIRCWMVDAVGKNAECVVSPRLIQQLEDDAANHLTHQWIDNFGGLATNVRRVMANYNLTDSGGGGGHWHLGCHCTHLEAQQLCAELYKHFFHAIEAGLLKIERKQWSLALKPQDSE